MFTVCTIVRSLPSSLIEVQAISFEKGHGTIILSFETKSLAGDLLKNVSVSGMRNGKNESILY